MKLDTCAATRSPQMSGRKPGDVTTEFQLHKSQLLASGGKKCLYDYSEFRLKKYIEQVKDEEQKSTLEKVLREYKQGLVAVAWKSGRPVWFKVTKETTRR